VGRNGGKLKNTERWSTGGQNIEIIDRFKYLGITSENKYWRMEESESIH
jgi:hypothetical protein